MQRANKLQQAKDKRAYAYDAFYPSPSASVSKVHLAILAKWGTMSSTDVYAVKRAVKFGLTRETIVNEPILKLRALCAEKVAPAPTAPVKKSNAAFATTRVITPRETDDLPVSTGFARVAHTLGSMLPQEGIHVFMATYVDGGVTYTVTALAKPVTFTLDE